MPKTIISDWSGGLVETDKNTNTNQFSVGDGVDIHTEPGYLKPFPVATTLTKSDDTPQIISTRITDILMDTTNLTVYFHGGTKLYQQKSDDSFNTTFDGSNSYHDITNANYTYYGENSLIIYKTGSTPYLFYTYGLNVAADANDGGDIGRYDLTSTFDDDFMSTSPTNAAKLKKCRHPLLEWNTMLWIGNGRHLAKYDGSATTHGTLYATQLDLGYGWEITGFFPTNNYLAIVARKASAGGSEAFNTYNRVFFYDGTSTNYTYFIELSENLVESILNHNGDIILVGNGRNPSANLMRINDNGNDILLSLKHYLNGTQLDFYGGTPHTMTPTRDGIFFTAGTVGAVLFHYGRNKSSENKVLTMPAVISSTNNDVVTAARMISGNLLYIGWKKNSGTVYYISKIRLAGDTFATANYKHSYTDMGQKVFINYIKYYFKPLASGDSITCGLETDYGTTITLKDNNDVSTCTYANDGAITSKKFMVGRECHAFRPTITWNSGKATISKIVIDYSFLPNDN